MAILGSAKTGKYLLGNFELRVGPQNMAGQLDDSYSLGIVDNVTITSSQDSVDMQGMFPQEILDTAVVKQTTEVSATLREFSQRNINLLTGNGYVADTGLSGTATVTNPGSATTTDVHARLGLGDGTEKYLGANAIKTVAIIGSANQTPTIITGAAAAPVVTPLSQLTNLKGALSGAHADLDAAAQIATKYIVPAHLNFNSVMRNSFSGPDYGLHSTYGAVVATSATATTGKFFITPPPTVPTPGTSISISNSSFAFPTGKTLGSKAGEAGKKSSALPFVYTHATVGTTITIDIKTLGSMAAGADYTSSSHKDIAGDDKLAYTPRIFAYTSAGKCVGYLTPTGVDSTVTASTKVTGSFTLFTVAASTTTTLADDIADIAFFVVGYADGSSVQTFRRFGKSSGHPSDEAAGTIFSKYLGKTSHASTSSLTSIITTNATLTATNEITSDLVGVSLHLTNTALTPNETEELKVSNYDQTTQLITLVGTLPTGWLVSHNIRYSAKTVTTQYSAKLLAQQTVKFFSITASYTTSTDPEAPDTVILKGFTGDDQITTLKSYYPDGNFLENATIELKWKGDDKSVSDDEQETSLDVDYLGGDLTNGLKLSVRNGTSFSSRTDFDLEVILGGNSGSKTAGFSSALLEDIASPSGEALPKGGWNLTPGTDLMLYQADDPSVYQVVTIADAGDVNDNNVRLVTFASPVRLTTGAGTLYKLQLIRPVAFGKQTSTKFFSARLILLDRADNVPVVFDFWKCTLSSGANFPINTSDFAATDLRFNVIAPSKRDEGIYPTNVWKQVEQSKVFRYAAAPDAV